VPALLVVSRDRVGGFFSEEQLDELGGWLAIMRTLTLSTMCLLMYLIDWTGITGASGIPTTWIVYFDRRL
jgi:hypothetical protein